MKSKFSRRDFLSAAGKASLVPLFRSPLQVLVESILGGAFNTAAAQAAGITPRRYLQIMHEGAPPRWMSDLMLTPYDSNFVRNPGVGTRFADDGKSAIYSTVSRKGLNVPHLWQYSVPRAGGGTRPLEDLLANTLFLRGINVNNPAHGGAQIAQSVPTGATQSMSALSGDPSETPIPSINTSLNQFRYLSKVSKNSVAISSSGNMLSTLLTPFIRKDLGGFDADRASLAAALDSTVAAINAAAVELHPNADTINQSLDSAKQLMSQGFGDLEAAWDTLFAKYSLLIQQAVSPTQSLPGINDKPIFSDGSRIFLSDGEIIPQGDDIRTMITKSTDCEKMAAHFAITEYVLVNNLSSSLSIGMSPLSNLTIDGAKATQSFDEHNTGVMPSLMVNTYFYLAFSACLLELIDQLKSHGIFQETVIVVGGEFGRSPHNTGMGSDHGYRGGNSTLISGALPAAPVVLGNIYLDKIQDTTDSGTWGYGAPVAELGKEIVPGNWASTIATLLRVPSAVPNGSSLLVDQGGTIKPVIELAKQVAG